jgi:hypothetical protein
MCTPSFYEKDDVTALMTNIVNAAKKYLPPGSDPKFRLNYVLNNNVYTGYCFVIVEPPALFQVLTGNNPDGTPRTHNEYSSHPPPPWPAGFSWDQDGIPPILEELFHQWDGMWLEREIKHPPLMKMPDGIVFEIARFPTTSFEKDLSLSTLIINDVPIWVTEKELAPIFGYYSISASDYPLYSFTPKNDNYQSVMISYRPGSCDALFAMQMLKYFTLKGPKTSVNLHVSQAKANSNVRRAPTQGKRSQR